jgi:hypothetical protein
MLYSRNMKGTTEGPKLEKGYSDDGNHDES